MTYSETIPVETLATTDDLWLLESLFRANWESSIRISSSYDTDIKYALSASEQRFGLIGKPVREITCSFTAENQDASLALQSLALRRSIARSLFPLFTDPTWLTSAAQATDTVINCDTRYRRFAVNQRIVIVERTSDPKADVFIVAVISSLTDSTITLSAPIGQAFSSQAVVMPLIEAQIILNTEGTAPTGTVKVLEITAKESEGPTQLETSQDLNTTPSEFAEYDGLPILDIQVNESDEVKWGVDRYGSIDSSGVRSIPTVYGSRGSLTWELPYLKMNRASLWPLLKFFDSRGGALFPFWFLSPDRLYSPISISSTGPGGTISHIRVSRSGAELDWSFRPYFAVRLKNGTTYIRGIASVLREPDTDLIQLSSPMPVFSFNDIDLTTLAFKARLDDDTLTEDWITDETAQVSFKIRELLDEKDIAIENLQTSSPTPLENKWKAPGKCGGCGAETIEECLCGCVFRLGSPLPTPFCCYVGEVVPPPDFAASIVGVVNGSSDQNFRIAEDERAKFPPGKIFIVSGSTGNDGTYTVAFSTTTPERDSTNIFTVEPIPDPTSDGTITTAVTHDPDELMTARFRSVSSTWTKCTLNPLNPPPPDPDNDCGDPCDPWIVETQCPGATCPCTDLSVQESYSNAAIHEEIVEMLNPTTMLCNGDHAGTWVRPASMRRTIRESGSYPCFPDCTEIPPFESVEILDGGLLRSNTRSTNPPEFIAEEWWVDPPIRNRPQIPIHEGETCEDQPQLFGATLALCNLYLATLPHGCFDVDGEGDTFVEIDTGCIQNDPVNTCYGYARLIYSVEVEIKRCSAGLWSSEFLEPSLPDCTVCRT